MKLFADFRSTKNPNFDSVQLGFSLLHFLSGNPKWFCRIWRRGPFRAGGHLKIFGQAFGKNKFQAYREALKDLNS